MLILVLGFRSHIANIRIYITYVFYAILCTVRFNYPSLRKSQNPRTLSQPAQLAPGTIWDEANECTLFMLQ